MRLPESVVKVTRLGKNVSDGCAQKAKPPARCRGLCGKELTVASYFIMTIFSVALKLPAVNLQK